MQQREADQFVPLLKVSRLVTAYRQMKLTCVHYVQLCTENQCNQTTLTAFYTNFATEFFHTVFTKRAVLKGTLRRDQKLTFLKSPISSPVVMP